MSAPTKCLILATPRDIGGIGYRQNWGYEWLLHDANTAVELTLRVIVVDVGVSAAHVGGGD